MRLGVVLLLVVAAAFAATRAPATAAAPAGPCATPRIGFLGPLTGRAAFLGKEQLGFARHAARTAGRGEVRIVEADTQLDPVRAEKAAAGLHANKDVLAVVGPAGSQEVLAAAPVLGRRERLAFVSASALGAALTNGSIRHFFRVVPSERAQAPAVVRLLRRTLKAEVVAIVDDGTSYSLRLADRVQAILRAHRIVVSRSSVDPEQTDFAGPARRVARTADAVFLPFQVAATAQLFGEALRERRKDVTLVGSDALDSRDFTIAGSYVASFVARVRVAGYTGRSASKFGPPAYVAAQVAAVAIRAACADGRATRREVLERIRATDIRGTALGRIRFTSRGDVRGASYSMLRLG